MNETDGFGAFDDGEEFGALVVEVGEVHGREALRERE